MTQKQKQPSIAEINTQPIHNRLVARSVHNPFSKSEARAISLVENKKKIEELKLKIIERTEKDMESTIYTLRSWIGTLEKL